MRFPTDATNRARELKLISFDVDGVLTDGQLYYTDDGHEIKAFNVQDGAAIKLLLDHGIEVAILTGRSSPMVARRAQELGITHLHQGLAEKRPALAKLVSELALVPGEVCHVGDDLADLELFADVGLAISVPNGHPVVQRHAHFVTRTAGGAGVAREVAELVLRAKAVWPYDV